MRVVYVCTALLTAASVAACGIIGFVGLVVPHAVRTVRRPIHRSLLPLVFRRGGCFLVLCDIVSRVVVRPLELPVGVDHRARGRSTVRGSAPADARMIVEAAT